MFMFMEMRKKRLGMIIKSKSNHKEAQRDATSFINDGDFCASGVESETKT